MPGITRAHAQLINYVEPQGVTVVRTTKGLLFRFPNGGTEMIHFTQSDYRATRNARANFRRNGIEWPGDSTAHKVTKNPSAKTLEAVAPVLAGRDNLIVNDVARDAGVGFYAAQGALVKLGWWRDYGNPKSSAVRWHPPIENPSEVVEEIDAAAEEPEPTPTDQREFLDTVDSWAVDLDAIANENRLIYVNDLVASYRAAGLAVELRVWKA